MVPKTSLGKLRSPSLALSTDTDPSSAGSDTLLLVGTRNDEGGKVDVKVSKKICFPPNSFPPDEDPLVEGSNRVREAWMEYHWKKGGGLPIVILDQQRQEQDVDDSDNNNSNNNKSSSKENLRGLKRVIAPVFMKETISSFPVRGSEKPCASLALEYKVTSPGPFFGPDLVEGSHIGRVEFVSSYANDCNAESDNDKEIVTVMEWSVQFDAIRRVGVYQKVTEFTIGTAAKTVQEAASTPRLLTISTSLPIGKDKLNPARVARSEWLDFLYSTAGGGLPLPPPIPFGEILPEGGGIARKKRYIFPTVVETAMVQEPSTVENEGVATLHYQLENPGWWTFPFLFHTHLGRIKFQEGESMDGLVDMTWEVEIRPYAFCAPLVEKLTEAVVTTIARNLRIRMEAPEARVELLPGFLSVPKGTWIGRVLDFRTQDERTAMEQTMSFLQPWSWGDSGSGCYGEDEVVFGWSDTEL